ncbi:MAG TPA: hypothetical protein VGR71_04000 [Nitrospira sp.]|nr:hypothetical protein [Nitrospira sp.]
MEWRKLTPAGDVGEVAVLPVSKKLVGDLDGLTNGVEDVAASQGLGD